jgi:hypothetical protein
VTVSCCQPVIGRGIPVSYRLFVPENGAVIALVSPAMIAGQAFCPGQVTRFPSLDKVRPREKRPRQGETGDFRGFEQPLHNRGGPEAPTRIIGVFTSAATAAAASEKYASSLSEETAR